MNYYKILPTPVLIGSVQIETVCQRVHARCKRIRLEIVSIQHAPLRRSAWDDTHRREAESKYPINPVDQTGFTFPEKGGSVGFRPVPSPGSAAWARMDPPIRCPCSMVLNQTRIAKVFPLENVLCEFGI